MKGFDEWYKSKGYQLISNHLTREWCCRDVTGKQVTPYFAHASSLKMHLIREMQLERNIIHTDMIVPEIYNAGV